MKISGTIIYTDGGGSIYSISFDPKNIRTVPLYQSKSVSSINHISALNPKKIVFDECSKGECNIKQYDIDSGKERYLRSGSLPSYIQSHDKLFFYDHFEDAGNWLLIASLQDTSKTNRISKEPEWVTFPNEISQPAASPAIQVSNDEAIFVGKDRSLWIYNFSTDQAISLNLKNCRPILWRSANNQLLCSDWNSWDIFLLDIEERKKTEVPMLNDGYGFVYIPKHDSLIYGKSRSNTFIGESYDILSYRFSDQTERVIIKNKHLAAGIWLDTNIEKPSSYKGNNHSQ